MFESLFDLTRKVKTLNEVRFAVEIFQDNDIQRFILRANRIDQLVHGLDSNNEIIGVYSPTTDISSEGLTFNFEGVRVEKIAGEPYNFIDSGQFFNSFEVLVSSDGSFEIEADDSSGKDTPLTKKYGKDILGLTDDNKNELVEKIIQLFIEKIREHLL